MTRLADDRRARVPFALIGVLLLVGSVTVAATLSTRGPARLDRSVDVVVDRTTAETQAAIRSAAADAAARAARRPVVSRGDTPAGQVLNASNPFRDALRVRIYLQARDHLDEASHRRGEVRAVASLPATPNVSALRAAKRRVGVRAVENGTAMHVRIRGVEVTVRRSAEVVTREARTVELTVATPVLALHRRAEAFERRLDRGPLEGPGLGRRLTARLYPIVWARGYAQHTGAPVQNVLANRHVELTTNGALLAMQREQFGRSDRAGRVGFRRAAVRAGVEDLLGPHTPSADATARRLVASPNAPASERPDARSVELDSSSPTPETTLSFRADQAADRAIVEMVGSGALARALRRGYRVDVRLRSERTPVAVDPRPEPEPPGDDWNLHEESTSVESSVVDASGPRPAVASDERRFATFTRLVDLERTVRRTWTRDNETATTSADWNATYRVGVALVGEYAPGERAPARPTRPLFEPGGPLGGPNLADVPERARRRAVERRGGPDAVAALAARGALETDQGAVVGDRPSGIRNWTRADLSMLRGRVGNVSVAIPARELATGEANVPAVLADRLRERRSALLDAPGTYRGAAERARARARAVYLDAVVAKLESQAERQRAVTDSLDGALQNAGVGSLDRLRRIVEARRNVTTSRRRPLPGDPPGGSVVAVPDTTVPYLTSTSVGHRQTPRVEAGRRYYPLSARNRNLFAVPYGDAADAALDSVDSTSGGVRLRTAARVLVAANRTAAIAHGTLSTTRTRALEAAVDSATGGLDARARRVLARRTTLSTARRRRAVSAAMGRWSGTGRRALAAANGSLAEAVVAELPARFDGRRRARLRVHLRVALRNEVGRERVPEEVVNQTRAGVDAVADRLISQSAERGVSAATRDRLAATVGGMPAGLPVVPVPGHWYVTVNVWTVQVRGVYARFALRTRRGRPGRPLTYVRDGSVVRLDVDVDGDDERLGRADRVDFETRTVVTIAVPPNGRGVGDVGGHPDERSDGWPNAGVRERRRQRSERLRRDTVERGTQPRPELPRTRPTRVADVGSRRRGRQ